jgi:hypothetical protein
MLQHHPIWMNLSHTIKIEHLKLIIKVILSAVADTDAISHHLLGLLAYYIFVQLSLLF